MARQKKKNNKKILVIALAGLVFAGITLVILEKTHVTDFIKGKQASKSTPTTPFDTSTPEQKQQDAAANAANKQQVVDKGAAQPTPPAANSGSQSIDLSAKQESNNTVTVFTKLYGYSGGSCGLTVTNSSATINQSAAIIYAPDYSSCAGFSVPISGLGMGDWNISLKVNSNSTSATKRISFKVM